MFLTSEFEAPHKTHFSHTKLTSGWALGVNLDTLKDTESKLGGRCSFTRQWNFMENIIVAFNSTLWCWGIVISYQLRTCTNQSQDTSSGYFLPDQVGVPNHRLQHPSLPPPPPPPPSHPLLPHHLSILHLHTQVVEVNNAVIMWHRFRLYMQL